VTHWYHLFQIMKEWAEADYQSKNLPKSERQSLNEVISPSLCRVSLLLYLTYLYLSISCITTSLSDVYLPLSSYMSLYHISLSLYLIHLYFSISYISISPCSSTFRRCCRLWRSRSLASGRSWWRPTWPGWWPPSTTTGAWRWRAT